MDGCYVPNLFGGIAWLNSIRKASDLTFDVHLMVREPGRFLIDMKKAGADVLTVHYEACRDVKSVLRQIKDLGAKSGIALNPETRVDILDGELLAYADVVHLMLIRVRVWEEDFVKDQLTNTLGKKASEGYGTGAGY